MTSYFSNNNRVVNGAVISPWSHRQNIKIVNHTVGLDLA